ncbi:hypothetical protein [Polyangium sp. 6x1]|uniref:hypothetical protein n=1 Tax=Polyangium sp. 6x1 TaxID=3042689 RepID=UPI002482E375|nr:hypothetical protein [Polyangium sp. 6x1]MDI1446280.1 hypothetical protein [Polyangium sp. 6x1]
MRFISAFAAAAGLVTLGGCFLVYDYSEFSEGDTSGQGGTGGMGGAGGAAGSGPCDKGATESCFSGPPGAQNEKPCQAGIRTCLDDGTWGTCQGETLPDVELCSTAASESCKSVTCPAAEWSQRYGDDKDQEVLATAVGPNGNVLLVGRYRGVLAFDPMDDTLKLGAPPVDGLDDAFMALLFPDGNPVQVYGFNSLGEQPRRAVGAAWAANGRALVAGYFTKTGAPGDRNIFLASFTQALPSLLQLDGTGDEEPVAVATENGKYVYLVGTVRGTMKTLSCPGAPTPYNAADEDLLVLNYELENGQCAWARVFPGGAHKPRAVTVDGSGGIYVTGSYTGKMDVPDMMVDDAGAKVRAFVMKLDTMGKAQWVRTFGGVEEESSAEGAAIAVEASSIGSKVFVTGTMSAKVDFGNQFFEAKGKDSFVLALDKTNGDTMWSTQIPGSQDQVGTSLALTADGGALIAGHFSGLLDVTDTAKLESLGNSVFLLKLSADGALAFAQQFVGTGELEPIEPRSIRMSTGLFGTVLAGGWARAIEFPPQTASPESGGLDVFVAQFPTP